MGEEFCSVHLGTVSCCVGWMMDCGMLTTPALGIGFFVCNGDFTAREGGLDGGAGRGGGCPNRVPTSGQSAILTGSPNISSSGLLTLYISSPLVTLRGSTLSQSGTVLLVQSSISFSACSFQLGVFKFSLNTCPHNCVVPFLAAASAHCPSLNVTHMVSSTNRTKITSPICDNS